MTAEHAHGSDTGGEVEAQRGDVWQEADGVLLLCIEPGALWQDFRGDRFRWDAPRIARPLRRLLDPLGNLVVHNDTAADAVLAEARRLCCGENPSAHHAATDKHSELMAFAGRLAGAVRGR
jgi:hypothetical protein